MQTSPNTSLSQSGDTSLGYTEEELERNRQLIDGQSGFFSYDVSYLAPDDTYPESRKFQSTVFHPLELEADCPCGSGMTFGNCCHPVGLKRIFTLNPDGDEYSPMVFYTETWTPWPDRDKLRNTLNQDKTFFNAEDSEDRAFWNYRGEGIILRGPGPLLFGTVELAPGFLKIEGVSRVRHASLRAAVEQALGEPLPAGTLEVEVPGREKSGVSDGQSGAVLEEYRILRKRYRELTSRAKRELMRDELNAAAKDLKMLGRDQVIVFEDESETDLLIDYGLFDVKRHGESIIQHFMRKNPSVDQQDELLYQGFANSLVSLFQIAEVTSGLVSLRDLLVPDRTIQLADYNLSLSAQPGFIIFTRILFLPCFAIASGGWVFFIDEAKKEELLTEYQKLIRNCQPKERVAQGILFFKKHTRFFKTSATLP